MTMTKTRIVEMLNAEGTDIGGKTVKLAFTTTGDLLYTAKVCYVSVGKNVPKVQVFFDLHQPPTGRLLEISSDAFDGFIHDSITYLEIGEYTNSRF